jgi:small subunit ribosomal protein S4
MGFAPNRISARQLVTHGHFIVNGRKVSIPSCGLRIGDTVEVRESSRTIGIISESLSKAEHKGIPSWLEIDMQNFKGKILQLPTREDIQLTAQEQLIVEFYSK